MKKRTISESEFQKLTKPTLRLFLSADLENSTRLKQSARYPSNIWLGTILSFIHDFAQLLDFNLQTEIRGSGEPAISTPEIWKILGDELIFVSVLSKQTECLTLVKAFKNSLTTWNEDAATNSERGILRVKGSAWLAGFPVGNAAFHINPGAGSSTPTPATITDLGLDFSGPSIDLGFRIGKTATSRKLAISVDLAWFLLKSGLIDPMYFEGPVTMKGIAEDTGYPYLWIEVGQSNYIQRENGLLGRTHKENRSELETLCAAFIEEFGVPQHLPFLDGDFDFAARPDDYDEHLAEVKADLRENVYTVDEEPQPSATDFSRDKEELLQEIKDRAKDIS